MPHERKACDKMLHSRECETTIYILKERKCGYFQQLQQQKKRFLKKSRFLHRILDSHLQDIFQQCGVASFVTTKVGIKSDLGICTIAVRHLDWTRPLGSFTAFQMRPLRTSNYCHCLSTRNCHPEIDRFWQVTYLYLLRTKEHILYQNMRRKKSSAKITYKYVIKLKLTTVSILVCF